MKIIALLIVAAGIAIASASPIGGEDRYNVENKQTFPCPDNLVFSCLPRWHPEPCDRAMKNSMMPVGAHSENVPTIVSAPHGYHGLHQQFMQIPSYYQHQ